MKHPAWLPWELGLSVVPVPLPSAHYDGKRPVMPWKEYQSRRATYDEMRWWFGRDRVNYAVVTGGVSGIVVVDLDDNGARAFLRWNFPRSPWIVKTSRGWHVYYRYPDIVVPNRARVEGVKIDVRGDGGYVIGPGSLHASGFVYRATGDWSALRASLPVFDLALLAKPASLPAPPRARVTGNLVERGRRYLAKVPMPVEGCGSDEATFVAACKLIRGFGIMPGRAAALLREWAPDFDAEWIATKVRSAMAHGSEIIGGRI